MRISILILSVILVTKVNAQAPQQILRDVLSRFMPQQPTEQPVEQALDPTAPEDSPEARRQALWESATKIITDDDDDPNTTSTQPTATTPHAKNECIDPAKFRPGQVGYLDYYLFTVADVGRNELYLAGEDLKEPFCLTGIHTMAEDGEEEYEKSQLVAILGYVMVRGTKTYEAEDGNPLSVRVVKLLNTEESEFADAQRAILETEHPMRTWTSKDGKHKLEARFLKFGGGKVHLMNKAGKSISISPNNLSTEDRAYYRDLVKKARERARKTAEEDEEAPAAAEGESFR